MSVFEKTVYVNVGADKASVKQENGIWVCKDLTVNNKNITEAIVILDKAMGQMNTVLNGYNKTMVKEKEKKKKIVKVEG